MIAFDTPFWYHLRPSKESRGNEVKSKSKKRGRANGYGTLVKTASGLFIARWIVNGKLYKKSTGTHDRREAEAKLEEFTAPFRLGSEKRTLETMTKRIEGVTAEIREWEDKQPALSIPAAWGAYERSALRPDSGVRTLSDYAGYYSGLEKWLKQNRPDYTELREVTQADAEEYAANFKANHSAGTFNKRIVFFRAMWRVLMECTDAKLTSNPWEKIQKREVITHSRRELTVEELTRVCSAVDGEMRLLFAIGIYTGLRLGDCALLEWGTVDLARGRIATIPRKTARHAHGKPTIIPIHSTLAAMLAEVPQNKRKGYVLPDMADKYKREPSMVTNRIQKVFRDCGIETQVEQGEGRKALTEVGFHSLRHTFVSLSANAGAPIAVVQAIVGHSNPAMTRHYFHEQESALVSAVAALPDLTATDAAQGAPAGGAPDAVAGCLRALCAIYDRMDADGLRKARVEIDRRLADRGLSVQRVACA